MHRFFVEPSQIENGKIHIRGGDVNHMKNVLRMKQGQEIAVCDGAQTEYICRIVCLTAEEVLAEIIRQGVSDTELTSHIYLFQGLPKSDKMELIIQKAVELGVYEVIPVVTSRTVVRLDEKKAVKKITRWQQIAESAAKQSHRTCIPGIHPVCNYRQALEYARQCQVRLIPYENARGMKNTRKIIESISPGQNIAVFIGPEGGFSEEEIQAAIENGTQPVTLGKRILRTETAGMTMLSILMFQLEED